MRCEWWDTCPIWSEHQCCEGDFISRNIGKVTTDTDFCTKKKPKIKITLGQGKLPIKGFINVDILKLPETDKVQDLNAKRWNFPSDYADEIYAANIVEHLDSICNTIKEMYRILKKGGIAIIRVPYYNSIRAFMDPQHKWAFNEDTLNVFFATYGGTRHYEKTSFRLRKMIMRRQTKWSFFIPTFMRLPLSRSIGNIYGEIIFILEKN